MHHEPSMRDKLLDSALRLFARQGYEGTSVRQICENAGANPSLISYYFGGKEAIFAELFNRIELSPELAKAINEPLDSPVDGLRILIREMMLHRFNHPHLSSVIQIEKLTQSERSHIIQQWSLPIWIALKHYLQEGGRQGLFSYRSVDTALSFVQSLLLSNSASPYWKELFTFAVDGWDALVADMTEFIFRGLRYEGAEAATLDS